MSKCIIITDSTTLKRHLRSALSQHDLEIEKEPLLHDLIEIRNNISKIGNTSEIRIALGNYIKNNGMPPLIILDYNIDLGLSREVDPDQRKLLRTIFISYVILLQGKGYNRKKNYIALAIDESHEKQIKLLCQQPHLFFKIMTTENPKINDWLKSFSGNPALAKEYFHIDYLIKPTGGVIQGQIHKIHDIVTGVKRIIKKEKALSNIAFTNDSKKESATNDTSNHEPIHLSYRFKDDQLWNDGTKEQYDEAKHGSMVHESLYVNGSWQSLNQKEGYEKIQKAFIQEIIPKLKEKDENKDAPLELSISLSDKCKIDSGIIPALITLIEKELKNFGQVSVNISAKNKKAIENTAGFRLLDKYILQDI